MERVRLDQHALQIQFAEQLPQHCPLVVLAGGVAGLQIATPKAAEYSVTWAMNAEPPPGVVSIEPLRVLPSHTS